MLMCPTKLSGLLTRKLADISALPYVKDVHAHALAFRTGADGKQIKVIYKQRDFVTLKQGDAQTYLELLHAGYVGRFKGWEDATGSVLGVFFNARHEATQSQYQNRGDARAAFVMDEPSVQWCLMPLG